MAASFALAGDDDSVGDFIAALTQTQAQTGQLLGTLNALNSDLQSVINILNYPQTVSNDLDQLNSVLSTASTVLTAVSIIPEISAEAETIQTAIRSLQAEVTPAKNAADAINAEVAPLRDALTKIQSMLGDLIKGVTDIQSGAQSFQTHFQQIDTCINNLPDGSVKTAGLNYLSSFAATATPPVDTLNSALGAVNGTIADFKGAIDNIASQLSFMSEISGAIDSLLSDLSPLLGPLQSLSNLLDTKITIPTPVPVYGISVSIRDILTEFQQFEDLVMNILNPILQPILAPLQQLANSIISQIPGLSQLMNLQINIPGIPDFSGLFGNLTTLESQLQGVLNQFTLTCPPAASLASFSDQMDAHMKDLSDVFGHGALHSLALGGSRFVSGIKGKIAASGDPVGRASLFRAQLDASKRVVLTQASSGKTLSIENGAPVLSKGPATPAAHFEVVPGAPGKVTLKSADGQTLSVGGKSEFKVGRH